ncbi:MAG: hypothetical protein ACLPTJ_08560 [Solirubrobacteraceae bacterium]
MGGDPIADSSPLIVQVPSGGPVAKQLASQPPASSDVVVVVGLTDDRGNLEPPAGGEVVLSVPSPEALSREANEVRRVIAHAGTGTEPLVLVVEAADELRDEHLSPVIDAATHASRAVILRVIRSG